LKGWNTPESNAGSSGAAPTVWKSRLAYVRLLDTPQFPQEFLPIARGQLEQLRILQHDATLGWTFISPAAIIVSDQRTGKYRPRGDQLITDGKGESRISAEHHAVALLNALENARHVRQHFTVAY